MIASLIVLVAFIVLLPLFVLTECVDRVEVVADIFDLVEIGTIFAITPFC